MRTKPFLLFLLIAVCIVPSEVFSALPASSVPLEYQVKAAGVYNFIKFIEWPAEFLPDTLRTIAVGVLGAGDMHAAVDAIIAGMQAKGRELRVKHFGALEEVTFCHVLFISRSMRRDVRKILRKVKGSSTLTVSELEGFVRAGGMINVVIERNRLRFDINLRAARRADLHVSSYVLKLARSVKEK